MSREGGMGGEEMHAPLSSYQPRPYLKRFVSPTSLANFLSPDSMNESEKSRTRRYHASLVASDDFLLTFSAAFCVFATDKLEIKFA